MCPPPPQIRTEPPACPGSEGLRFTLKFRNAYYLLPLCASDFWQETGNAGSEFGRGLLTP